MNIEIQLGDECHLHNGTCQCVPTEGLHDNGFIEHGLPGLPQSAWGLKTDN
jgi:hypothetical protein